jgi:murein L,D-transpeptidase YcbB/YkuD
MVRGGMERGVMKAERACVLEATLKFFSATALAAVLAAAASGAPVAATEAESTRAAAAAGQAATPWSDARRVAALIDALRDAPAHALPIDRYAPDRLAALPPGAPETDAALTDAFLRYARDVSSGLLEPRRVAPEIKVAPPRPDRDALLGDLAVAPDPAAFLAGLAPRSPEYAALRAAYAAALREIAAGAGGDAVPGGPTLRLGDAGPRVVALRARLAAEGHVPTDPADPARFDAGLELAVRAFQRTAGLNDDGAVGPATLAALNAGPVDRARKIAVNLERLRWTNRPVAPRRIEVNQAAFTVTLIDGDAALFEERVVIGTRQHQTPEFDDEMEYLVLNPTWHVPSSIAVKELLPELQADPSVLARRGMRLVRNDGGPLPADPYSHDFTGYTAETFPYRIRQNPSDDNALGRVKFMFPNGEAIYLHDTPSKRLFQRDVRAYSHGCVRVQDPLRLAELLLAPQTADPRGFIDATLARGAERYVNLERHVPVRLTYRTAWIDRDGALQLRGDVYGRDAATLAALEAAGVALPQG